MSVRFLGKALALSVLSLVSACSWGQKSAPVSYGAIQPHFSGEYVPVIGALMPRVLDPGKCGLFLWSTPPKRELVFFSSNAMYASYSPGAIMMLNGVEVYFRRSDIRPQSYVHESGMQQFYNRDLQLRIDLTITVGKELKAGEQISDGLIRLKRGDGWETVATVSGLAACQPRNP